tara:strand:- start:206 stop:430 length:225 start_codon:yes stop_codon:yes gene_type:complete
MKNKIQIPKVSWWQWVLDSVFLIVGFNAILGGNSKWGIALIVVGILAFGYDFWRWKSNGGNFSFINNIKEKIIK